MPARIIDACVHHRWPSQLDVMEYMSSGWREYLGRPGLLPNGGGMIPIAGPPAYRRPGGDVLDPAPGAVMAGGAGGGAPATVMAEAPDAPGTTPKSIAEGLLDPHGIERAVLTYGDAMLVPAIANPRLAAAVARAANDWTADRWLSVDDRLRALILAPSQTPDEAATEIRRMAADDRMVGVLLSANSLSKPFGHPVYRPIFEAAVESGLPVILHAGGDAIPEALTHPTAGGVPTTYAEYWALESQAILTHIVSVIGQAHFETWPELRVLVSGAGAAWVPGLVWRFDGEYQALRREAPWLKRLPSDYLRDHVYVSTFPYDRPADPGKMQRLLNTFEGIERMLVFGSGYPRWDTDWPAQIEELVPEEWQAGVFAENALSFFRW